MSDTSCILFHQDERGVATLTLNRPQLHNAFDESMIAAITDRLDWIERSKETRLLILAANGKHFSAGADLEWMRRMAEYDFHTNLHDANLLAKMLYKLNHLKVPTLARVHGSAYGGAIGLIACCDMAFGCKLSQFSLSEVKLGLIPATISPYVIDAIGMRAARRYFLTGEIFSATEAKSVGLLTEAVTEEELTPTIEKFTRYILNNAPTAVSAAKALIFDVMHQQKDSELNAKTGLRIALQRVSEEGQAGLNAFLNKMPPPWHPPLK